MKIIKPGGKQNPDWWVGVTITCPICGQQMQLEAGDQHSPDWIEVSRTAICISCPNCREFCFATKP